MSSWLAFGVIVPILLFVVGISTTIYTSWSASHLRGTYNSSDGLMTVVFHPNGSYDWYSVTGDLPGQYQVDGDSVDMIKHIEAQMPKIGADTTAGDRGAAMFNGLMLDSSGMRTGTLSADRKNFTWVGETFTLQ